MDNNGNIGAETDGVKLDPESYVSMNFWGFPAKEGCVPPFLLVLEEEFKTFFVTDVKRNPLKAEYLLPTLIGGMLREKKCTLICEIDWAFIIKGLPDEDENTNKEEEDFFKKIGKG